MMPRYLSIGNILALAAVLSVNCNGPSKVAGTSTETENIAGILHNPDGTRAARAKVKFVPADFNPGGAGTSVHFRLDSAVTDDTGHYGIDTLPANTYNLLFSGNGNLGYRDSVKVRPDSLTKVPPDTLKTPGSLHGRVRLQLGDDPRTVSILFIGTMLWVAPNDSTGRFDATSVAAGAYKVRFLTTLDNYSPLDTILRVMAGKADTLFRDIVLRYTGIPVPAGLRCEYDTLRQIVSIRWNRPLAGRPIMGYRVYRREQNTAGFTRIAGVVVDTAYSDSTVLRDLTYEYRVAALDMNESEGVKSAGVFVNTQIGSPSVVFSSPTANTVWAPSAVDQISWAPDSSLLGRSVNLFLYKGALRVLQIVKGAPNSGAFTFTAPSILATGNDYRVGIARDSATRIAGFSALFGIHGLAPDAFEPDGDRSSASPFDSLGRVQSRTLTYHDTDWVKFRADSGRTYRLRISGEVSTLADLFYNNDPNNYSAFFDADSTKNATLLWPCVWTGQYYLRIISRSQNAGGVYSFSITRTDTASMVFVTTPSAGTVWNAESTYQIKWTPDSSLHGSRVMLYLLKGTEEAAGTFVFAINTSNTGQANCELVSELTTGNDYRIKVTIYSNITLEGYSDMFSIRGITPDVYEPDNNRESASTLDTLSRFQQHTLTSHDTDWVKFSADSGVFYELHASGDVPTKVYLFFGNGASCVRYFSTPNLQPWVCPKSGLWYARISLNDTGAIYDTQRRAYGFYFSCFDKFGKVIFITPPCTSAWHEDSTYRIRWAPDSVNLGDYVMFNLFKGDKMVLTISDSLGKAWLPNSGYFDWTVPLGLATGSDYRIALYRQSSPTIGKGGFYNFCLPFTILGAPSGAKEPFYFNVRKY